VFYAASAALLSRDVQVKSHAGTRTRFADLFVRAGQVDRGLLVIYTTLMTRRMAADYDGSVPDTESVRRDIDDADAFVSRIRTLI